MYYMCTQKLSAIPTLILYKVKDEKIIVYIMDYDSYKYRHI